MAVLRFSGRRLPRSLASVRVHDVDGPADIDAAIDGVSRAVVVGTDADLAAVLTRLMRTERLDVEVAHAPGWRAARRARIGVAQRVPLIRDESGTVVVSAALWLPPGAGQVIHGEAVVDDEVLFDGEVTGVRIEPTRTMPGLRATVLTGRTRRRWLTGRAAQLGTTGARVVRDGVPADREVKRAALYRHTTGWLRVS
ncbi:peptidase M50 [Mycolicibacterium litorale]|nr:peptidase M50 [Mycolicibacterium litorale]